MLLTTKRFVLRDFVVDDFPAFEEYHADPRSSEFYGPERDNPRLAAELVQLFMAWAVEEPRLNYQLAIVQRGGPLIGCGGLRMKDVGPDSAELGLELAPAYWGRYGYATEIMKRLVNFGFDDLGLARIFGTTVSENARIARLVSAFGAVSVECSTPVWMAARGWRQIEWRIDREQWLAGPSDGSFKPKPLRGPAMSGIDPQETTHDQD